MTQKYIIVNPIEDLVYCNNSLKEVINEYCNDCGYSDEDFSLMVANKEVHVYLLGEEISVGYSPAKFFEVKSKPAAKKVVKKVVRKAVKQ